VTAATVGYETGLISSAGTVRRLQALVAIGWPQAQLARELGMRWALFADLMRSGYVSDATAAAVRCLYDRLWDKPPAGRYAARARRFAAARDWPPPLGWDEDCGDGHDIDDPDATPAPGWKRTGKRKQASAQVVPDALWLMAQGHTREQAAERLGLSRAGLEKAFARQRQLTQSSTEEEDSSMPFDPAPKPAPGYMRGASYAHTLVMRQVDAGHDADHIEERQKAAAQLLADAASSDDEREFARGYAETAAGHITTLRDAQRARAEHDAWERQHEAGPEPEREAG
jgi:hypothetical protein